VVRSPRIYVAAGRPVFVSNVGRSIAVESADVPACSSAEVGRTVHEAVTTIDNESSTVEHVVVAGSTATRAGWTPVVPVNVLTGGRAKSTGATVALPVDGVIPVWTVACVIVAHAIGVVSAEVLA